MLGGRTLPGFKTSHSYNIKIVWYWHKDRIIAQWNRIQNPETSLHVCGQWFLTRVADNSTGERQNGPQNVLGEHNIHVERNEAGPLQILFINVNSKNWKYITLSLSPNYYNHCSWFWPWCSFRIYRILAKFLAGVRGAGKEADSVLWEQETVWTWPWLCWAGNLPLYQLPLRPTNKRTSILSPRASGTFPLSYEQTTCHPKIHITKEEQHDWKISLIHQLVCQ